MPYDPNDQLTRRLGVGRQQGQRRDVARPDDPEVTMIERRHPCHTYAFSDSDDGRVGTAKTEVGVALGEISHEGNVGDGQLGQFQLAGLKAPKEALLPSHSPTR